MATFNFDLIVYGGTIHGLITARRAASYGMTVCVLEWTKHVGGMFTGGLGVGDWSTPRWGYMKQMLQRIASRPPYNMTDGSEMKDRSSIEAKEAMTFFLLDSPNVTVIKNARLKQVVPDPATGAVKKVVLENGDIYNALHSTNDGSYEVDLAFMAKVPMRGGRDGVTLYDEQVDNPDRGGGMSTPGFNPGHHAPQNFRGYDLRGDRIRNQTQPPRPGMRLGEGSAVSQSYGWRFSLMRNVESIPWSKPSGWGPADSKRIVEMTNNTQNFANPPDGSASGSSFPYSVSARGISGTVTGQPGRYSTNGTDMPGIFTDGWCEMSYRQREIKQSKAAIEVMGAHWVWANDSRISGVKRTGIIQWGLPLDEFVDDYIEFPGWPAGFYVRDGRCIVGQYMMSLTDVIGRPSGTKFNPADAISTGGYPIDIHTAYYFTRSDGLVNKDGGTDYTELDYGISLRACLPEANVCPNMTVSWGLCGTSIFRSSYRMEETVACVADALGMLHGIAWSTGRTIGQVPYSELKAALTAVGAVTTV
ncbi:FAD-dependent oxidoreductase [Methylobacterium sp. CM6244]